MSENLTYHVVAQLADLDEDYPKRVRIDDFDIALFLSQGEVYATHNICTHEYALMADGFVDGDTVECPLHGACFNFKTGKALTEPATVDLKTYPVRIEAGQVLVGLPG